MATAIQRRRGTTAQHAAFTGQLGEVTVDTDKKTLVVHDGVTAGGHELQRKLAGIQSIKWLGAKGDGVTRPMTGGEAAAFNAIKNIGALAGDEFDWACIQLAVSHYNAAFIPAGTYRVNRPVLINTELGNRNVRILGEEVAGDSPSGARCRILHTGSNSSIIQIGGGAQGFEISNIYLGIADPSAVEETYLNVNTRAITGILFSGATVNGSVQRWFIHDMEFGNLKKGIHIDSSDGTWQVDMGRIVRCSCVACIRFLECDTTNGLDDSIIESCRCQYYEAAFWILGAGDFHISATDGGSIPNVGGPTTSYFINSSGQGLLLTKCLKEDSAGAPATSYFYHDTNGPLSGQITMIECIMENIKIERIGIYNFIGGRLIGVLENTQPIVLNLFGTLIEAPTVFTSAANTIINRIGTLLDSGVTHENDKMLMGFFETRHSTNNISLKTVGKTTVDATAMDKLHSIQPAEVAAVNRAWGTCYETSDIASMVKVGARCHVIGGSTDSSWDCQVRFGGNLYLMARFRFGLSELAPQSGMKISICNGAYLISGAGTPEGNVSAPIGSHYMRTDGGAGTSQYKKESGSGNTGWVAY